MSTSAPPDTEAQPKIKLYWLNDSRAQRIAWLLEELNLPYDIEIFRRGPDMLAPPELEQIHPLGKSPVVTITLPPLDSQDPATAKDCQTLVLAESGFITQYLAEHFGGDGSLLPKRYRAGEEGRLGGETDEWMRYQYYLHYAEGSLMPPLLVGLVLDILKSPRIPFFLRPITSSVASKFQSAFLAPQLSKHLSFLASQLSSSPGPYLCGAHLTAADILMSFPLLVARQRVGKFSAGVGKGTLEEEFNGVWTYLERMEQGEGWKRAEERVKAAEEEVKGKGSA
ncbi:hypothetical protein C8A05DRAFT_30947 [Staphylotrichum tortipilum]|uniref:GST N-terminal domain-containing protein n=1 Tax=Staphylotrichum tortipilum TaxID=2831512 RepID=A0AAN6MQV1_9PEZI|nr:hypothetical protein C8A05DRAFT_30947 [Staphylotrichum longicolle]